MGLSPEPAGALSRGSGPSAGAYGVTAVLLLSAFVALLWVPSYAHLEPSLVGIPFFYWYTLVWLLVNAACQVVAYQLMVAGPRRRAAN
ncbi:MAG TPA: DUF3311 domain-containing protein [Acidimicrobiales bacterium]|nr:DUF3311 domain-containing protein [Acidimicrobiales bacterium]